MCVEFLGIASMENKNVRGGGFWIPGKANSLAKASYTKEIDTYEK